MKTFIPLFHVINAPDHIKRLFRLFVMFAFDYFSETPDGLLNRHINAFAAGENFGHLEGLRQKFLDFAGTPNQELIIVGKFLNTQNSDYVLKVLIALQNSLNLARDFIMFFSDN